MAFYNYEDRYIMPPGTGSTKPQNGNEVQIACKNKDTRIYGYISEGIKINGKATWKEMFNGGIAGLGKGLLQIGSNIEQIASGLTLQQPWMNRKFYQSTSPFSFTFGVNFVSHGDAANEVFMPAQYLLSLIYPRKTDQQGMVNNTKNVFGTDNVVGALLNTLGEMVIPGPSVLYTNDEDSDVKIRGDAVTIVIGQMFAFGGVYLEDVDVQFSPSFDDQGFPLSANCKITATCMDVNYCNEDGSFLISQFGDGQADGISQFTNKLSEALKEAAEGIKAIVKSWKGFFGIGDGK